MSSEEILIPYPVLPIRNAVAFPQVSLPLVVGRPRSLAAIERSQLSHEGLILVVTQKLITSGDPNPSDLNTLACLCRIESVQPVSDSEIHSRQLIVSGIARFRVESFALSAATVRESLFLEGSGTPVPEPEIQDPIRASALLLSLRTLLVEVLRLQPDPQESLATLVERIDSPGYLADLAAAYLPFSITHKQEILETLDVENRVELLLRLLQKEREVLQLQGEIRDKMSERLSKSQRDALLREQIRTIRAELGEEAPEEGVDELTTRLKNAQLPEEASRVVSEELRRIRSLPPSSAEYHVLRNYLEWIAAMPWRKTTQVPFELRAARRVLDEDHSGLEKVKRRIIQHLAVTRLRQDLRGPLICLVGPPGVGKTSLGRSIARALGRKFARAALGGIRDEAEIRGHRRTYVGAMPGRIIQSVRRAGTRNPVLLLDEIDKLRQDFHGDPSSALLEVLDPEQNRNFVDHYLDIPFDLSDIFFIATANSLDAIPAPLRDRLEVIEIPSYTIPEKTEIARTHLIPDSLRDHGLEASNVKWDETALERIVTRYTREAGVRELQRKIAGVHRLVAEKRVERQEKGLLSVSQIPVDAGLLLTEALGAEIFPPTLQKDQTPQLPGVCPILAWTPTGGELLEVETRLLPGRGGLLLTGSLGDVLQESARIALSLVRAQVGFDTQDRRHTEIHLHIPSGATPKDGPSAGVGLFLALLSAATDRAVQPELAVTGEITLRGAILPVGGVREKILAAHRAGIKTVLIPKGNASDLADLPTEVREGLKIHLVTTADEASALALEAPLEKGLLTPPRAQASA